MVPLTKGPLSLAGSGEQIQGQHRDKGLSSTVTRTLRWSESRAGRIPEHSQPWLLPLPSARQEGAPGLLEAVHV